MNAPVPETPLQVDLVIEAGRSEANYWRDLWRYRELLGFLAWRDLKVRYHQTWLGAGWALLQPAATIAIFTFVFGRLAKMPDGGLPYVLVVMSGQLGWQLFANALNGAGGSLVGSSHLISKVYFPRLVVPLSTVSVALVDFLIVLALYAAVCAWFGVYPGVRVFALPLFIGLALVLALGAGLWIASLMVKFRDFRILVPFLLQIGIFVTPVGYRTDLLPRWHLLLALNPLTGVVEGFRWCLLPGSEFTSAVLLSSVAWALFLALTGIWYFRRTERSFADVI